MDQLAIYNDALLRVGERKLSSLTDPNKPLNVLNTIWEGGAVNFCLEAAYWKFSLRTIALLPDPDITPAFGLRHAYLRPDDYLRTYMLCSDPYFNSPVVDYQIEGRLFYAEVEAMYIRYVSTTNGADMELWPPSFVEFLASYMAYRAAPQLTNNKRAQALENQFIAEKRNAMNKDVTENPPDVRRDGSWSRARGRALNQYGRR